MRVHVKIFISLWHLVLNLDGQSADSPYGQLAYGWVFTLRWWRCQTALIAGNGIGFCNWCRPSVPLMNGFEHSGTSKRWRTVSSSGSLEKVFPFPTFPFLLHNFDLVKKYGQMSVNIILYRRVRSQHQFARSFQPKSRRDQLCWLCHICCKATVWLGFVYIPMLSGSSGGWGTRWCSSAPARSTLGWNTPSRGP